MVSMPLFIELQSGGPSRAKWLETTRRVWSAFKQSLVAGCRYCARACLLKSVELLEVDAGILVGIE